MDDNTITSSQYKAELIKDNTISYDLFAKFVVIGDANVGKTSIVNRSINNKFTDDYVKTKVFEYNFVLYKINDNILKYQIWDMSGDNNYHNSLLQHYKNANLGILVYAIDDKNSFNHLEQWIHDLRVLADNTILVLIGNKSDLQDRKVSYDEGKAFAKKHNIQLFVELSAKTNEGNCSQILEQIAVLMYTSFKEENNENAFAVSNDGFYSSFSLNNFSDSRFSFFNCC